MPFTAELYMSNPQIWRYDIIWEKTQATGFLNAKKMPLRKHEIICTGRSFIGMELDAGYFEIAQKRIKEANDEKF